MVAKKFFKIKYLNYENTKHKTQNTKYGIATYILGFTFSLFIFVGIFIQSCSKENENVSNNKKSLLYANNGPFDLTGITISNDMVLFNDTSIMTKLDHQIENFNDIYNNTPNIICSSDTGNIAFENQLGFFSLRKLIDNEETDLENNDNLWDYNDPDDHFICDNFERTILNEKLEYGIDNTVYKYINEFTLIEIVDDLTTLNNIRNNLDNISPYLCSPNVTINSFDDIGTLNAEYTYTQNNLTFNFTNATSNATDYYWDFGDGTSSTLENPTHTYSQSGYYDVVLVASTHYNGVKVYDKKTCRIPPPGNCTANFLYQRVIGNDLELDFMLFCSTSNFNKVTWNWGDGTQPEIHNSTNITHYNHVYTSSGKFEVKVTIKTLSDCTASYKTNVRVGPNECRFYKTAPHDNPYILYSNGGKKFKYKFFIKNGISHHRIKAKIKNYKIKSNGSKKRERADNLTVNYFGKVYFSNECGNNGTPVNQPTIVSNKKKAVCKIVNRWGTNPSDAVRILDDELTAYFYASKNGNSGSVSIQINQ